MFCPHCGDASHGLTYCSTCGKRLAEDRRVQFARVESRLDVTVNVGGPTLVVSGNRPRSPLPAHRPPPKLPWSADKKWAVCGLFFWPLWGRFIWRQTWPLGLKALSILGIVGAYLGLVTNTLFVLSLLVGLTALLWVMWVLRSTRPDDKPEIDDGMQDVRDAFSRDLTACDDTITEIERTIAVELLSAKSPERTRYLAALESRKSAIEYFESAKSTQDVKRAREQLVMALGELRITERSVSADTA